MEQKTTFRLQLENGVVLYFQASDLDEAEKFADRHFTGVPIDEFWKFIDEIDSLESLINNVAEDFYSEVKAK